MPTYFDRNILAFFRYIEFHYYCIVLGLVYNLNMSTLTIPKKFTKGEELVILPREDYEKLLSQQIIQEYEPTIREKKEFQKAREDYKNKEFMTIDELKRKLGFKS